MSFWNSSNNLEKSCDSSSHQARNSLGKSINRLKDLAEPVEGVEIRPAGGFVYAQPEDVLFFEGPLFCTIILIHY
jgi:hypothetical protein